MQRAGRTELTIVDALLLAILSTVVLAIAIPLLQTATDHVRQATLLDNLRTLRSQIELYKLEHRGNPPILREGALPQMIRPTNDEGITGIGRSDFPHGPYLKEGVPLNPITGRSVITLTDEFPPRKASGNGGWLYHQPSGQIVPDLPKFLDN
ncbi:MAG: hypothetical protein ACOY3P_26140 [Planctomycetota bacterium]